MVIKIWAGLIFFEVLNNKKFKSNFLYNIRPASPIPPPWLQVAEENGLEVLDQLSANPVSTREPTAVGGSTLTMAEEEQLSRRSASQHTKIIVSQKQWSLQMRFRF